MKSTHPIVLEKHVNHAQGMALQEDGIQIVSVGFRLIANCKNKDEETRVRALNAQVPAHA